MRIRALMLAFLCCFGTSAFSQIAPDSFHFRSVTYAGSGCPAGSVAYSISPDRLSFSFLFDSLIAEAGPSSSLSNARKNCAINIDLEYPDGWIFTIVSVDYRGFANLQDAVNGTIKSTYYFQGSSSSPTAQSTLRGPKMLDFRYRDTFTTQGWSTCRAKRALNINSQTRVDNSAAPGNYGVLTVDSVDGQVWHSFNILWQRC